MSQRTKQLHVLHLIGSTGLYGAERWVLALMRALDPQVIKTTLVNLVDREDEVSDIVIAAQNRGLVARDYYTGGRFNPLSSLHLARWARGEDVRVVHGHGFKSDCVGLLAGRFAGCSVISTPHGWSVEKDWKLQSYERMDRLLFRFMNLVCPLSSSLAEGLKETLSPSKIRLVVNGVDIDEVQAALSKSKGRGTGRSFVIGYIGRLVPLKSLETLLQALHLLISSGCDVALKIIGEGPERSKLENLANELKIAAHIEFLGFREDAVTYFHDFSVFVLPSISEGIPRCLMEAMAATVPVIASDIPGNRNLVSHGHTGLLFSVGNSQDLADKIRQMMDGPVAARNMAKNGTRKVEEEYSSRRMAREYSAIYQELATGRM